MLVDGRGSAQLDQHDVVVNQPGLVVWMRDDAGSRNNLFVAVHEPTVVIAEHDVHFAEREKNRREDLGQTDAFLVFCLVGDDVPFDLRLVAVGGRHHPILVDQ